MISGFVMRVFLKAQNCFLVRRSHTLTVGVNMMVSLEFLFDEISITKLHLKQMLLVAINEVLG